LKLQSQADSLSAAGRSGLLLPNRLVHHPATHEMLRAELWSPGDQLKNGEMTAAHSHPFPGIHLNGTQLPATSRYRVIQQGFQETHFVSEQKRVSQQLSRALVWRF